MNTLGLTSGRPPGAGFSHRSVVFGTPTGAARCPASPGVRCRAGVAMIERHVRIGAAVAHGIQRQPFRALVALRCSSTVASRCGSFTQLPRVRPLRPTRPWRSLGQRITGQRVGSHIGGAVRAHTEQRGVATDSTSAIPDISAVPTPELQHAAEELYHLSAHRLQQAPSAPKGRAGAESAASFLAGNFAPVAHEMYVQGLEVVGTLPRELDGVFIRNGPNPRFPPDGPGNYHWFDGDGMLHAVRIRGGQASYSNSYVETSRLQKEKAAGRSLFSKLGELHGMSGALRVAKESLLRALGTIDPEDAYQTANTALLFHGGRLLALQEQDQPYHLFVSDDGRVSTVGKECNTRLGAPFTAHPKVDPSTGELLFFGANTLTAPYCVFGRADAAGRVLSTVEVPLQQAVMMHDFAITERFAVFIDGSLVMDTAAMVKHNTMPMVYDNSQPARIGLLRRNAEDAADMQWFDVPPTVMFHTANAWEEGDEVKLFGCCMNVEMLRTLLDPNLVVRQPAEAGGQLSAVGNILPLTRAQHRRNLAAISSAHRRNLAAISHLHSCNLQALSQLHSHNMQAISPLTDIHHRNMEVMSAQHARNMEVLAAQHERNMEVLRERHRRNMAGLQHLIDPHHTISHLHSRNMSKLAEIHARNMEVLGAQHARNMEVLRERHHSNMAGLSGLHHLIDPHQTPGEDREVVPATEDAAVSGGSIPGAASGSDGAAEVGCNDLLPEDSGTELPVQLAESPATVVGAAAAADQRTAEGGAETLAGGGEAAAGFGQGSELQSSSASVRSSDGFDAAAEQLPAGATCTPQVGQLEDLRSTATHASSCLYEFALNTRTGEVKQRQVSPVQVDFPQVPAGHVGRRTRFVYAAMLQAPLSTACVKIDLQAGDRQSAVAGRIDYGPGRSGGEVIFVPRRQMRSKQHGEDDGFLLTYVYDEASDRSELVVYNAKTMSAVPVARVKLPVRVPYGFHSIFITEEGLASQPQP